MVEKLKIADPERAIERLEQRWQNVNLNNLPYHVLLLGKLLDRATAQHVRESAELSLGEWRVMAHIAYLSECSASEISNLAFVDRAEVSRAIGSLEKRGLVHRRPSPGSRKSFLVSFTEAGQKIHDQIRAERGRLFADWTSDLAEDDRKALNAGLRSIIRRIVISAPDMISP